VDRITRKELKKDRFAEEVTHTVEYVSEHKKQVTRYGVIALAAVVAAAGIYYYTKWQAGKRAGELAAALELQNAYVGPAGANPSVKNFPTQEAKSQAVAKAFRELAGRYSGSDEGVLARYYLGTQAADEGRFDEAERSLKEVAASKNADYASLAQFTLAEIGSARGKTAEAEKLLRGLIEKPTVFVSKTQATIALARLLASTRPDEARKLVEPLRLEAGPAARAAFEILNNLPNKG
jgi:predicted negative regulator of RcsB-dependent stress response